MAQTATSGLRELLQLLEVADVAGSHHSEKKHKNVASKPL